MTRLFVYSLPWTVKSDELMAYLQGENFAVESAQVIVDKQTGQSKGFAFVEFTNEISARAALQAFQDGKLHLGGRKLGANEAHPRPERPQIERSAGSDKGKVSRSSGERKGDKKRSQRQCGSLNSARGDSRSKSEYGWDD